MGLKIDPRLDESFCFILIGWIAEKLCVYSIEKSSNKKNRMYILDTNFVHHKECDAAIVFNIPGLCC